MVQRDRTWSNMVQRGGEGEAFAYPASSAMMYCSDRKWSNVVQSDPWWSNMAESVTGWSKMVQRCRRWSNVVEHGLTLSNMVQLGPTSERSGFLSNKSTHRSGYGSRCFWIGTSMRGKEEVIRVWTAQYGSCLLGPLLPPCRSS